MRVWAMEIRERGRKRESERGPEREPDVNNT